MDFSEAEDITEKKMVRNIFKVNKTPQITEPVCFGNQICRDGGVDKMTRMKAHFPAKKLKKWVNNRDDQVFQ